MPVYRLQTTMRFKDQRDGFAIDIEAADVASAIVLAQEWRPEAPDLVADAMILISPEGRVLWSLRRMAEP